MHSTAKVWNIMKTSQGDFFADPPFYFVLNNFSYSVIINAEDFDQTLSAFQLNCVKSWEARVHKDWIGRTKLKGFSSEFTLKMKPMVTFF